MPRLSRLSTARGLQFIVLAVLFHQARLSAGIIDFETFPDGTPISDSTTINNQFPGLIFSNTTVISAGIGLNEFEFPPHSGSNVAFDDGGPIVIDFSEPVFSFGGYFTYTEPLTLEAFAANDKVASVTSAFSNNLACLQGPPCSGDSGSSPNEFLQVAFQAGISIITITGDPAGGSFTVDDVNVISAVPEPNSMFLLLIATARLLALRRRLI